MPSPIPSNLILADLTTMRLDVGVTPLSMKVNECLEILRCAPQLNELSLELGCYGCEEVEDCIQLANLRSLHMTWAQPGDAMSTLSILDGFETPLLTTLSMDFPDSDSYFGEGESDDVAINFLRGFISCCKISLTTLRMTSDLVTMDVVSILRLSPELKKLYLRGYDIPDAVIDELSKRRVAKKSGKYKFPLCPKLESIFLYAASGEEGEYGDIPETELSTVKMIKHRWNVPATERSLRDVTIGWFDPTRYKKLKAMESEGLKFYGRWEM